MNAEQRTARYNGIKQFVRDRGTCNISMLQRGLHMGYVEATRTIKQLEADGVVGPYRHGKPREILEDK